MIKKLKIRFIMLAMVSLIILLAAIVAGMNIINYEKVVSDADSRLEVLEQNSEWLLGRTDGASKNGGTRGLIGNFDAREDIDDMDQDEFFGRGGKGGPSMTRDEAEESRFFMVTFDEKGEIKELNISRIASVDFLEAEEYAKKAIASGKEKGFVDEFRYTVSDDGDGVEIIFLDCGRVLESYRNFLKASVLMSVIGLIIVLAVICYLAGRIVRPVAESYEKQKRFITDAGHEIKTPLSIIKANLDLMDMQIDNVEGRQGKNSETEELRDGLGEIGGQVDRLTGLTNDLVYLSRMEETGITLVMTAVPLSDIVSESIAAFEPLAREQGKAIIVDIAPAVAVNGNTKELEKLMSILLENAVKYSAEPRVTEFGKNECSMPATTEIIVELRRDGRNALIEVSNDMETDVTVTNEALSHVFERFYRTDGSRNSQTGGYGIGLSIASAIVSAHGGRIYAHTSDGRDFIITATLPAI